MISCWLTKRYVDKRRKEEYMRDHGSTTKCPSCGMWEHEGNHFSITRWSAPDDGSDRLKCHNCGAEHRVVLGPGVWIFVDDCDEENS